jgi:citrate lyase subunit beta / citryl-CoA lyase
VDELTSVETARTLLFVPGDRPDRFDKAAGSGADAVILDLEDAVAPEAKPQSREYVKTWLGDGGRAIVRVNGRRTPWFVEDVQAAAGASAVLLPKTESGEDVRAVRDIAGDTMPVIALVETPRGIDRIREICASDGLVRVAFGNVDFSARIGVEPTAQTALLFARSAIVYASSDADRAAPIDGPTIAIGDEDRLLADTRHARELGFAARLCIHPRQLRTVAEGLAPTEAELSWARSVLEAASGAVVVHAGDMIDEPVLLRARRLLADDAAYVSRATQSSSEEDGVAGI